MNGWQRLTRAMGYAVPYSVPQADLRWRSNAAQSVTLTQNRAAAALGLLADESGTTAPVKGPR
jgi:hypothetical protein